MKKWLWLLLIPPVLAVAFVWAFPGQALQAEYARQRWQADAAVKTQDVAGETWHYLEAGQGPLILLVHGYTGSKENWLPMMPALTAKHRVIAVDLPGWGESVPKPGQDYSPLAQAERLRLFIAAQKQPVALLAGHSMGGMISGLMLSSDTALPVEHVVFMSSAGVRFKENAFARRVLKGDNPFAVYQADAFVGFLQEFVFADAPYVPAPMAAYMVQQREVKKVFERQVFTQMRLGPQAFLLQERLPLIRQPVGLLWCDADKIIDPSAAAVFAHGLQHSDTRILSGCGHMPMMEQPQQAAEFLLSQL